MLPPLLIADCGGSEALRSYTCSVTGSEADRSCTMLQLSRPIQYDVCLLFDVAHMWQMQARGCLCNAKRVGSEHGTDHQSVLR